MTLRVLDLFAGIGGIALGLERAGMDTAAFCEIDPFCRAVLAQNFPGVPIHEDIKRLDGSAYRGAVDVVAGGFPCQDVSIAGRGKGITHGTRSGLWFEMRRVIGEVRPSWILAENVAALRSRGGDLVLSDLEGLGYSCWPVVVGAVHAGSPHRRQRVWIVGVHPSGQRRPPRGLADTDDTAEPERPSVLADPKGVGRSGEAERRQETVARSGASQQNVEHSDLRQRHALAEPVTPGFDGRGRDVWPSGPGETQHDWEEPRLADAAILAVWRAGLARQGADTRCAQQPMGGTDHGIPGGLVRLARRHNREALRAYGNSVVPQVVEMIGRWIVAQHQGQTP